MKRVQFLNSKESKELAKKINEQWDADFAFVDFVAKSNKDKFYIVSRDIEQVEFQKYNVEQFGVYFAHENDRGEIRLSVEGAQVIGPSAKKNVVDIGKLSKLWMGGQDIPFKTDCTGVVIVKDGDDYLGCGKVVLREAIVYDGDTSHKEMQQMILNFVPKTRRHVKD